MPGFDHERLDVYRVALDFIVTASDIVEKLPKGRAYLADQLNRAATSIVLNIAEGAGEFSAADKARFYRIACRSGTESAAILDVCRKLSLVDEKLYSQGRDQLLRVVSMLIRLSRPSGTGTGTGTGTGGSVRHLSDGA
jgi:four helix bundle protein